MTEYKSRFDIVKAQRRVPQDGRYHLALEYIATGPGWLAEVYQNGHLLEGRWFNRRAAARQWFRKEYEAYAQSE